MIKFRSTQLKLTAILSTYKDIQQYFHFSSQVFSNIPKIYLVAQADERIKYIEY